MDVARIRQRLGITRARLARLTGAHPMTVSKWERGVLEPNAHQRAVLGALIGRAGGATAAARRESSVVSRKLQRRRVEHACL